MGGDGLRRAVVAVASVVVLLLLLLLSACGGGSSPAPAEDPTPTPTPTAQGGPGAAGSLGLPFPAGTEATLGARGLHADNFASLPGGYRLDGVGDDPTAEPPGVPDASLDLLAAAGTPVIPLAAGTVLASWPECQVVLVGSADGTWVEYVHLVVADPLPAEVTRGTVIGTVAPVPAAGSIPATCGDLHSDAPHVHLGLLSGEGKSGRYVSIAGARLCGRRVTEEGTIAGLADRAGATFAVPACDGDEDIVMPTPTPIPTPVPLVLAGTWAAPKSGTTLKTSSLTLSAKPTSSLPDVAVAKVVFSVRWGSEKAKKACTATKAATNGTWSCKADLWKLGAPLGKLALSFDVVAATGETARAQGGTRTVTFRAPPGPPRGVHLTLRCVMNETCGDPMPIKVTWGAAVGSVSGYRIYFTKVVDFCAATWVFSKKLTLLESAGASVLSWTGTMRPEMGRVVVVAYNSAGSGKGAASEEVVAMDFVCGP